MAQASSLGVEATPSWWRASGSFSYVGRLLPVLLVLTPPRPFSSRSVIATDDYRARDVVGLGGECWAKREGLRSASWGGNDSGGIHLWSDLCCRKVRRDVVLERSQKWPINGVVHRRRGAARYEGSLYNDVRRRRG